METCIAQHIEQLQSFVQNRACGVSVDEHNGAYRVEILDYRLKPGWDRDTATLVFVLPAGFPAVNPGCFWVRPAELRLKNGQEPRSTSIFNPAPGDEPLGRWVYAPGDNPPVWQANTSESTPHSRWFYLALQAWDPNRDTAVTYLNAVHMRLAQAV